MPQGSGAEPKVILELYTRGKVGNLPIHAALKAGVGKSMHARLVGGVSAAATQLAPVAARSCGTVGADVRDPNTAQQRQAAWCTCIDEVRHHGRRPVRN